jgi:ATP-dependent DNA helicase PIF1
LDAAEIDLGESIFEYGQAYTALSRVKSLDALTLTRFSPKAFRTHPDVLAFYGKIV